MFFDVDNSLDLKRENVDYIASGSISLFSPVEKNSFYVQYLEAPSFPDNDC